MRLLVIAFLIMVRQVNVLAQWSLLEEIDNFGCLEEIEFTDQLNGFIVAYNLLAFTDDSGETWEKYEFLSGNFKTIDFINPDTGLVCCYPDGGFDIMITYDGGDTWSFPPLNISDFIIDIELADDGNIFTTDGILSTNIYKVTDNYTTYAGFNMISSGIPPYDLDFVSADTGFLVGLLMDASSFSSVYKTVDGGENWFTTEAMYGPKYQLCFINAEIGYGISSERRIWKTEDGGESWFMLPFDFGYTIADDHFDVGELYFYNSQVGLLETYTYYDDGNVTMEIRRTVDGGNTWYITDYPFDDFTGVGSFYCTSEDTCYFVTCDNIYMTTNGGGIDTGTSIISQNESLLCNISPNPATDYITLSISKNTPIENVYSYNVYSQKVKVEFDATGFADISSLNPGVYFTVISTSAGMQVRKWVKSSRR